MLMARDGVEQAARQRPSAGRFSGGRGDAVPQRIGGAVPSHDAGAIGAFDGRFFLYCEDTDLGLRARWAGWKCLYVPDAVVEHHYSHSAGGGLAAQGVLRGAQPPVRPGEKFSGPNAAGGAVRHPGPLRLAFLVSAAGPRQRGAFPRRRPRRPENGMVCAARARRLASPRCRDCGAQRREIRRRARITPAIFRHLMRMPRDQRAERWLHLMIRATGPDSLLVIVPAFNEDGAIANVVRSVHRSMPGVAGAGHRRLFARRHHRRRAQAGAEVLSLPHHLGLGGCVQAGYKLAYSLGFQYVIRVDGDGQHDARDIPPFSTGCKSSGCEMVIGSRFVQENGSADGLRAFAGHPLLPHGTAPHPGQAGLRSHFRIRGRQPPRAATSSAAAFRWNIRKSKRWWCCSAAVSASRKCP